MSKRISITTHSKRIGGLNQLQVEAGTNGLQGGDSGHGGRTYLRIADDASTDWSVTVEDEHGNAQTVDSPSEIAITLGGDSELGTFIQALEFALAALKGTAENASETLRDTSL